MSVFVMQEKITVRMGLQFDLIDPKKRALCLHLILVEMGKSRSIKLSCRGTHYSLALLSKHDPGNQSMPRYEDWVPAKERR